MKNLRSRKDTRKLGNAIEKEHGKNARKEFFSRNRVMGYQKGTMVMKSKKDYDRKAVKRETRLMAAGY